MIEVLINRADSCPLSDATIKKIVAVAAKVEPKVRGIVEITFVTNSEIRVLNRTRRGFDKPTDVLSFGWSEDSTVPSGMLGEIYLSYRYIVAQAKRFKTSAREETIRMLSHGLLHLAGHDHVKDKAAAQMFALQEKIVSQFV